jgi:Tol biopolymer transport system component
VTSDGRYVAFHSYATDLLADDCETGVFVRDLIASETIRVDVDTEGGCAEFGGPSFTPSISAGGRYVVFDSYAEDLVEHDTNGEPDVFVRDLVAGQTLLASVGTHGNGTDDTSYDPAISADGRYVTFYSDAHYLVEDDHNAAPDIFVHDLLTGTTIRASVDMDGADADGYSFFPSISIGGRYVAFQSDAPDIVAGDGNGLMDIFVRDLVNGTTVRASVDTGGGDPDATSTYAAISPLGGYVVFQSAAQDLIEGGDRVVDVFDVRLP